MFGIQGGYLGNAAGLEAVRGMSVPGELTGINPMTQSYPQNMGNTTGPLAAGLGAMPPRMVAGGPQLLMASMGGMPGAVGNMGGVQEFENELNKLRLPQKIRGSDYRYEQEIGPFDRKSVY